MGRQDREYNYSNGQVMIPVTKRNVTIRQHISSETINLSYFPLPGIAHTYTTLSLALHFQFAHHSHAHDVIPAR